MSLSNRHYVLANACGYKTSYADAMKALETDIQDLYVLIESMPKDEITEELMRYYCALIKLHEVMSNNLIQMNQLFIEGDAEHEGS